MSRLPPAAFAVLAAATVGAFFVTQHLKVSTPLIAGFPKPSPDAISPTGNGCGGADRVTQFSFYLLHRADDVAVYIVDPSGSIVRTLSSGRHMRVGVRTPDGQFPWNGREDDGRVAPDGTYYYRVALLHQNRTVEYTRTPVQVITHPPHPLVTSAKPDLIPQAGAPVTIHGRSGAKGRGVVQAQIYRTDISGGPRLVKAFRTPWKGGEAEWDGKIHGRPAPAGTYLVGLEATDRACNTGRFPSAMPPPAGSTPDAGVTVRYLAAQPPLDPVPAGSRATVYVDARHRSYAWALRRAGARAILAHGSSRAYALNVRLPRSGPDLYVLSLRSGAHRTSIPLVAGARPGRSGPNQPLVVLPALSWQGSNRVDDDHDGLPNTLSAGTPIELHRPLADGLPSDFADEAGFIRYLDRAHLPFDLTTDLGLLDGTGAALTSHRAVCLDGAERWLPASLGSSLRVYAQQGGHVVSIGTDSLLRGVTVRGTQALAPSAPASTDIFGVHPQPLVPHTSELITVNRDALGIFSSTSGALPGFSAYQPLAPGGPPFASAAGVGEQSAAVAGLHFGHGIVVEIALPGFGSRLAGDVDAQELVGRLWQTLRR